MGKYLYANYFEPKESRQLAIEEKLDKKAYESHISRSMSTRSSDLVSLITSLGYVLSQLNVGNQKLARPQQGFPPARPRQPSQQPAPTYHQPMHHPQA
jgi:hypothetical protein